MVAAADPAAVFPDGTFRQCPRCGGSVFWAWWPARDRPEGVCLACSREWAPVGYPPLSVATYGRAPGVDRS